MGESELGQVPFLRSAGRRQLKQSQGAAHRSVPVGTTAPHSRGISLGSGDVCVILNSTKESERDIVPSAAEVAQAEAVGAHDKYAVVRQAGELPDDLGV